MNCYNSSKYLKEAIDSVIAQSYKDWEIVFWDNQSTDNSAHIVKEYNDPRIKYFYAPTHTKLGEARNLAVSKVNGEWIAFLDCDDLWMPDKLEKQTSAIASSDGNTDLVYSRMYILEQKVLTPIFDQLQLYERNPLLKGPSSYYEGYIFPALLKQNFICISSVLVKKNTFLSIGGINPSLVQAEDFDLLTKVAKNSFVRVAGAVVYRVHEFNLSTKQEYQRHIESINVCKQFLPDNDAKQALRIYYTDLALYFIRSNEYKQGLNTLIKQGSLKVALKAYIKRFKSGILRLISTDSPVICIF